MDAKVPISDSSGSMAGTEKPNENSAKRITWNNKYEFAFNVIGYNVGLGNIWRFTYLCFKNGGGAFLIPYLLVAAFCGVPILFMEVAMGQYTRRGCIAGWDILPLMRGVGYSAMLMSTYFLIYFALSIGWCIIYLAKSFTLQPLPWATCDNEWNTENCVPITELKDSSVLIGPIENATEEFTNSSLHAMNASRINETLSTAEFWNNYVLQRSDGIHDMGTFTNWPMLACFIASWVMNYLCIVKGIRTTGKVAYITVLVPYILMIALLIRGLTLDGAVNGILFYITPNATRLADPEVWLDAGSQVMYSLGLCFGCLVGFGSYNKPNFDCYKSAYFFIGTCCGSSLTFGFVVFSFLGHMAKVQGKHIRDVVEGGPGLVFQVFPAELALLPGSQIWSAIFFLALLGLAIDGSYGIIEGCITALADYFPKYFGHKGTHFWRAGLCSVLLIVGLPQLFDGGIYIFELLNLHGASGICILWVGCFETIAIDSSSPSISGLRWNLHAGRKRPVVQNINTAAIFIACCIEYSPLKMGNYVYPWWANLIGWMLSVSVVASIPFIAIKTMWRAPGSLKQKWQHSITSIHVKSKFQIPDKNIENDRIANESSVML
uniref:sodium- and chloride-dependent betaine transporter-like isoform X2 n=1 Tax=Styela clava TaxID=7725 RepID=UPI0019393FC7|nr:sodium- and chloride-dependent betaine transporter-like isoform X2 [Styela clava]